MTKEEKAIYELESLIEKKSFNLTSNEKEAIHTSIKTLKQSIKKEVNRAKAEKSIPLCLGCDYLKVIEGWNCYITRCNYEAGCVKKKG